MAEQKKPLVLDLHIPYCIQPENFIDRMYAVGSNQEKNMYMVCLGREVLSYQGDLDGYEIRAIRLSGGSASVMSPDLLGKVLSLVREKLPVGRGAELSYDALPNTIGTPSLTGIAAGKPNRVELMMRSESDRELRALNSPFTMDDTRNAMLFFQKFHLNNVSVTVNYGIPGQTVATWHNTLRACEIMRVKHVTVLPLDSANDEATREMGLPPFPGEEERLEMYCHACEFLKQAGYVHYGVGLFALPGFESWYHLMRRSGAPVIGMGVNGISDFEGYLVRNTNNLRLYMKNAGHFEKLTAQVAEKDPAYRLRSLIYQGLGLTKGVSLNEVGAQPDLNPLLPEAEQSLEALIQKGWVGREGDTFALTETGEFHYRDIEI